MKTLIASLLKGGRKKMPIKLKPSQTVKNKQTGKFETEHYYLKTQTDLELLRLLNNDNTKPKVKQRIRNEITRRKK